MIPVHAKTYLSVALLGLLCTLGMPECASAEEYPDTPIGHRLRWAVETIGAADHGKLDTIFAATFLGAISAEQVQDFLDESGAEWGRLEFGRIEEVEDTAIVAAARSTSDQRWQRIWVHIQRAAPHRIVRIVYRGAEDLDAPDLTGWPAFDSLLSTYPGDVSAAVWTVDDRQLSTPIFRREADRSMGIGSAFKLWVLGAAARAVAEGRLNWTDTLAIRDDWKSLPSGRMQNDSAGTRYPVSRYARQMIAISDNTATDHLIHALGRERVEEFMADHCSTPVRNEPFTTTREFFQLKIAADDSLRGTYIAAAPEERRALLQSTVGDLALPPDADLPEQPTAIEQIEYFASTDELCRLVVYLDSLSTDPMQEPVAVALTANDGLRWDAHTWSRVAYKGGSEPGVLNLTWLLDRVDGSRYAVCMTWNDPSAPIDSDRAIAAAYAAGKLLARE